MNLSEQMAMCIQSARNWTSDRTKAKFGDDSPAQRVLKRRFKPSELEELVGVTRESVYKAEKAGRLPQPDYKNPEADHPIRLGYTLAQIDHIRDVFGTQPYRPNDSEPVVVSVAGGKGGSWKTSTTAHFAQWLALKGYRVAVVDIDPQAHLSMYFGYHPELNTTADDTVLNFMLGHSDSLKGNLKDTAWHKIKIIPSHLQMQRLEREIVDADIPYQAHQMLYAGIQTFSSDFDVVIIDGHPDLGMGTMNMIAASDAVLVATSTEINDINSTCQLMGLIQEMYTPGSGLDITHEPIVRVLPTKIGDRTSSSYRNLKDMRQFWGGWVLSKESRFTDEVGKGQRRMATIYEQADASERSTPKAWKRATDAFDDVFSEILDSLVKPLWEDE